MESNINSSIYLRNVMDILEMKSDQCKHKDSCAKNFIKQLLKSTGTGLGITFAFRMLRHIRNIGRPTKM